MARFSRLELLIAGLVTIGCGQGVSVNEATPVARSESAAEVESAPAVQQLSLEQVADGGQVDPFADPEIQAVVLVFVSTDCPIANRYAPTIEALYERYRSKPVGFWLVFPDPSESREAIHEHLAAYRHAAPALRDPEHRLVEICRATKTPEAVVFAPRRKLAYRGRIDDLFTDFGKSRQQPTRHDLRDAIDAVLEGRAVDFADSPAIGCDIPGARP